MAHKYLVVVAGPTAVGKTELGIQLAKFLQTEIISADSRQLFRELSIGTAKPGLEELKEVQHHFINHTSVSEDYNAGLYEKEALLLLKQKFEKKDVMIMVGGSGQIGRAHV